MKKRILLACLLLALLAFGAAACGQQTNSQTLTELLMEVNSLPQLTADGEVYISIHDRGMEEDFTEDGLPADLLQDATIKYHVNCNNEASLYEAHLSVDFPCYDEPQECTLFLDAGHIYVNMQDLLEICAPFAEPDELAEARAKLAGYDWMAWPLAQEDYAPYYNDQTYLEEMAKINDTILKAYAGFSPSGMTVKGNSFQLELDNAGLAGLINDFIDYTLDNFTEIAQACIAYVNSSSFFDEIDRESIVEMLQEAIKEFDNITEEEREYLEELKNEVRQAFTEECPMDFAIKYALAKTAADTYTLEEKLGIVFDEEEFGEPSDVLITLNNTSKAMEDLQITVPTENIAYAEKLREELDEMQPDM